MIGLDLAPGQRWFLVHTLPRNEHRAQFHLRAQSFRTYAPEILRTVRHARQLKTVRAALFPGYVFVILDPTRDRWLSIRSTFGVASLIAREGRPLSVPNGVVEALIEHTDAANLARLDTELATGQSVRILSGPFAELVGTLERLDAAGRVRVLLDMMGTAIPVALHRSVLLPAACAVGFERE